MPFRLRGKLIVSVTWHVSIVPIATCPNRMSHVAIVRLAPCSLLRIQHICARNQKLFELRQIVLVARIPIACQGHSDAARGCTSTAWLRDSMRNARGRRCRRTLHPRGSFGGHSGIFGWCTTHCTMSSTGPQIQKAALSLQGLGERQQLFQRQY